MFKIPKQEYSAEFKELAVKRVKSGETVGAVARDLGLVDQDATQLGQGDEVRLARGESAGRGHRKRRNPQWLGQGHL